MALRIASRTNPFMPTVHLRDRALIAVEGEDAETFLQNIITTDLAGLGKGEARPGALLSPQGKILFDFLISRAGDRGLLLDCRAALADDFVRRLILYRLRAKATIAKQEQPDMAVSWGADSGTPQNDSAVVDRRFPEATKALRYYVPPLPAANADNAEWDALRVEHGVAESGSDYAAGDAFPHDVLLDQNGGVGFRKGCYIGQEVVSRMQHRGTARRRVMIASGVLPGTGTEILANGRAIGALGTVAAATGLAIVRIDRVKEALDAGRPITAGGAAIALRIPPFAGFTFPEAAAAEEA
jgi:folate-binding protein YgfZ